MKIVIIGDGKVGHKLAKQLSEQSYDVVIIDKKVGVLKQTINDLDINCVEGDGANHAVQLEAGVNEADLLIASASTDEVNMICCLLGKKLGAKQTIARVRNPVYYQQMHLLKDDLGLSMAVNPDFTLSEEIARVLIFPAAARVETFAKGRVELVELRIHEGSMIAGLSLAEIYQKYQIKVLICAVQRNQQMYIPDGSFILMEGDKINIAASHNDIKNFFKLIGKFKQRVRTVMICGGSRAAYYLSQKLLSIGISVKIIEKSEARCLELCDVLPKATIIHGNGAEHELLIEEGIRYVDAFVALTGMDEENIIMSMYAQSMKVQKVITKVNGESLLNMTDQLGLETVVSPKSVIANSIISYVRAMQNSYESDNVETLYRLIDERIEALEFIIKEKASYTGITLNDLELKENILIACIVRNRRTIIPRGNDTLEVGDSVVIVTMNQRIQSLKDIIRNRQVFDYEL